MFEKLAESKNESSNRRRFLRRIAGFTAVSAIAGLIHARNYIDPAFAGNGSGLIIGQANTGSSVTELTASISNPTLYVENEWFGNGSAAISGVATALSGDTFGVQGATSSNTGKGVYGYAGAFTGTTYGVYGGSGSTDGTGVYGTGSIGVSGESYSVSGIGVKGYVNETIGETIGVYGRSDSEDGWGVHGVAWALTGKAYGVVGLSYSEDGTGVMGVAGHTIAKPIVARGFPFGGQTANLQEWQATSGIASACIDATGSVATTNVLGFLSVQQTGTPYGVYMSAPAMQCMGLYTNTLERVRIDSNGNVGIGTTTPNTPIHIESSSSNPSIKIMNENNFVGQFIYCFSDTTSHIPFFSGRRARGNMKFPSAVQTNDILMRYGGAGYGTSSFPGGNRAILEFKAAQNWTDTNQGTYITFSTTPNNSATAAERMRITDSGEIIPPTDNTGSIGTASRRWNLVRATTVTSGDLAFENSFRVTEDGESKLAFTNPKGEKIAVLDDEGNLYVKGEVKKLNQ